MFEIIRQGEDNFALVEHDAEKGKIVLALGSVSEGDTLARARYLVDAANRDEERLVQQGVDAFMDVLSDLREDPSKPTIKSVRAPFGYVIGRQTNPPFWEYYNQGGGWAGSGDVYNTREEAERALAGWEQRQRTLPSIEEMSGLLKGLGSGARPEE